jgi:hypothetical protein
MKVKELIKELLEYDQEAEVIFSQSDGCCGEHFDLNDPDIDDLSYKHKDVEYKMIRFYFPALPFLSSCIASGIAQRAVASHRNHKNMDQLSKELDEKKVK